MGLVKSANLVENLFDTANIDQAGTRDGYGEALVELGKVNENVVVLCADLTESTRSNLFQEAYPDRYIQMGVAEQNLITVGAGLAVTGKIPYMASYAAFSPGRCWEQIRTNFGYNELKGVVAGAHAGVSVGPDGPTHQAVEDLATMRTISGCTVLAPADRERAFQATMATLNVDHLSYIRFGRDKYPMFTTKETPFEVGKAEVFYEGSDVTVVACGPLVYEALLAANELEGEISVEVIDSTTIKPLDEETIINSVKKTGAVVSAEEATVIGGLGGAVAEALARNYPVPMEFIGMQDIYGESGKAEELLEKFGMTSAHIIEAIRRVIKRK
ncbi:MAG: transketolase C-terminal domain-containing protein [bacterium]|nr:transketolase C-terminal domain-containing protein [bacterium]